LHVTVSRVSFDELMQTRATDASVAIRARVESARSRQSSRLRDANVATNAAIAPADVRRFCALVYRGADCSTRSV
jgi:magnesium chelatase family protein